MNKTNFPIIENNELNDLLSKAEALLCSYEEIKSAARPMKEAMCGVYFLLTSGNIVYVGQSTNVFSRLGYHHAESTKVFDSFAFIPCAVETLNAVEALYIRKFKPRYNTKQHASVEERKKRNSAMEPHHLGPLPNVLPITELKVRN